VASPTLTTNASPGGPIGPTTVTDTATLSGGNAPTGTIEFKLFGPSTTANCSGTAVFDKSVTVTGNGAYTSPAFTPAQAGTYWWTASYGGDSGNHPAASGCGSESVTIGQVSPGITTTPSSTGTGNAGSTTVKDTATLSGGFNPAGTIAFTLYGPSQTANCTTTPVNTESATVTGNGSYTTPTGFTPSQGGTYWWTVSYTGDANNKTAASGCGTESVTITSLASPSLTTASSSGGPVGTTSVTDTASLSGGNAPAGTIEFKLFATANCSGTAVFDKSVTVGGNGGYTSPAFTPAQAGTYYWTASYSGDTANNPAGTTCGADSVTISQLSPGITTAPSSTGTGTAGSTTVKDTATLSGGFSPIGTITFTLYGPSPQPNCSAAPVDTETASVTGNGSYTTPAGFTPAQGGTYWWTASYGGDINNATAASGCGTESVTIGASPGTHLYWADSGLGAIMELPPAGGAPAQLAGGQNGPAYVVVNGGTVYWADTVTGAIMAVSASGGTPTVLAGGQNGPAYLAVDNGFVYWADTGSGTIMKVSATGGTPIVLASGPSPAYLAVDNGFVYWADSNLGAIMDVPVTGGVPAQLVGGQPGPAYVVATGGFVYWANSGTGAIMSVPATGGVPVTLASGPAGPAGPAYLAVDSGTVYWADRSVGAIMAVPATGGPPPVMLAGGQNGPAYLAVDSGFVYWVDTGAGPGTLMKVSATGGTPVMLASGPSPAYLAAASPASPALMTTPSTTGTGTVGSTTVKDTATLSGAVSPTGTITFNLYGPSTTADCSGTPVDDEIVPVSNGSATTPNGFTPSQVGTYWWTASYSGDASNTGATSGCGQESITITPPLASPALTTSPDQGGPVGTGVTDTATLSGGSSPTGSITFTLYGPSATANCSGTPVGSVTATVTGDGSYTSPAVTPGQAGTYWWTAGYGGDSGNNKAVSGCGAEQVVIGNPALGAPGISTTPSPAGPVGTTVTDAAALSGGSSPGGTIEFKAYGPSSSPVCTGTPVDDETVAVSNGSATTPNGFTPGQAGTYWWTASYSGDSGNNPAISGCGAEQVVVGNPALGAPALTTTPGSGGPVGTTVTDAAALSGGSSPGGTIEFKAYGPSSSPVCTGTPVDDETVAVSNGSATTPNGFTPGQAGTYWWTASYGGDSGNNPAVSGCGAESATINKATPAITTKTQPQFQVVGGPVADTATVTGGDNPTGTVTFNLYGNSGCTGAPLFTDTENLTTGAATSANYHPAAAGTDYWVATYNGDGSNSAVSSACGAEHVIISLCLVSGSFADLGTALEFASAGETLTIQGTCTGTGPTVIAMNLTLQGQGNAALTSNAGSVLIIAHGATVTINSLTITGGHGSGSGAAISGGGPALTGAGGGIFNQGTVTLNGVTIKGNTGQYGGGLFNDNNATATLFNSIIGGGFGQGNSAASDGGGIFNNNSGTLTLNGTTVTGNTAGSGGGLYDLGLATLNSSSITGNTPNNCFPQGLVTGCTG
jgi:hypothetical protein